MRCSRAMRPIDGQRAADLVGDGRRAAARPARRRPRTRARSTPSRPGAWSRTVPAKVTTAPHAGSTAHAAASATGSGPRARGPPTHRPTADVASPNAKAWPCATRRLESRSPPLYSDPWTSATGSATTSRRPVGSRPTTALAPPVRGGRAADAPARRRATEPRLWTVAVLAGLIASMLTSALIVAAGGFRRTVVQSAEVSSTRRRPRHSSPCAARRRNVEEIAERMRPVDRAGRRADRRRRRSAGPASCSAPTATSSPTSTSSTAPRRSPS